MTEPQSWVLIGTFSSAIFGMLALFWMMLTRFLDAKFAAQAAHFDAKFDALNRDVQAIARKVFGSDAAE